MDPILPAWLPDLTLHNLQVGSRRISLSLHRDASGHTHHEVVAGGDGLRIHRPGPLPEGVDRIAYALATLAP